MTKIKKIFISFLPFWIFMIFFKWAGGLHYSTLSPLGEKVFSLWFIGILIAISSIIQMVLDVPAGHLLDRYGYKKLLTVTAVLFLFAGMAFMLDFNKATYLISLLASTFGWMFFGPGVNAYVLSHAPTGYGGRFMSFREISGSIGIVLSSAILGIALQWDTKILGIVIFSIMFIACIAISLSPPDTKKVTEEKIIPTQHYYIRREYIHNVLKILRKLNPASFTLLMVNFVSSVFYGIVWFVVPLLIYHQANSGILSIGLGIFDFSVVVLGYGLGTLSDTWNKRTLVFFGLLLFGIAAALLSFNFSWLFLIFGFLATTGEETSSISLWSWLHALDKEHVHDGLVSGVINLFEDLGWAIGPLIAGILYPLVGASWTIAFAALLIFITWIIYQFLAKYHVRNPFMSLVRTYRPRHKE